MMIKMKEIKYSLKIYNIKPNKSSVTMDVDIMVNGEVGQSLGTTTVDKGTDLYIDNVATFSFPYIERGDNNE